MLYLIIKKLIVSSILQSLMKRTSFAPALGHPEIAAKVCESFTIYYCKSDEPGL